MTEIDYYFRHKIGDVLYDLQQIEGLPEQTVMIPIVKRTAKYVYAHECPWRRDRLVRFSIDELEREGRASNRANRMSVCTRPLPPLAADTSGGTWRPGAARDLVSAMARLRRPCSAWPKRSASSARPRAVTSRLRRLAPAFRKTGWQVSELPPGHANAIRWRFAPPVQIEIYGEDAREPSQGSHGEPVASDASERERVSGTSPSDCTLCGGLLDPVLIAAGLTDHGEAVQ